LSRAVPIRRVLLQRIALSARPTTPPDPGSSPPPSPPNVQPAQPYTQAAQSRTSGLALRDGGGGERQTAPPQVWQPHLMDQIGDRRLVV
jgi:hypothetical protein